VKGLKLSASESDKSLVISLRSSKALEFSFLIGDKEIGKGKVEQGSDFKEVKIALNSNNWQGAISSLDLKFRSESGAEIEIDYIRVER